MTKQEQEMEQRRADFAARCNALAAQGYREYHRTITIVQANLYALLTAGPLILLCVWMFLARWRPISGRISLADIILLFAAFLVCIPLHELLHGLAWSLVCRGGFKSIRFGFMREYLTPYCHCREPLRCGAYMFGCLAPLLVLGFGLFALAWAKGSVFWLYLALMNILAAGGDTTLACMLMRHRRALIVDHPCECGFAAFEKP